MSSSKTIGETTSAKAPDSVQWVGDSRGHLRLIDQTALPTELKFIDCHDVEAVWEAIKMLRVRGAPAIGIAAAYGVCVAASIAPDDDVPRVAEAAAQYLATSRPTAVNLFWALDRMQKIIEGSTDSWSAEMAPALRNDLHREAGAIHDEDRTMCHAIGRFGSTLIPDGAGVLTHCNAGGLATAEYGTALSVFFTAQDEGKSLHVFVDETRPLLQGARLTAWELMQRNIPATLICDSMAAQVMREGRIQAVVTGADRIAANGDAANKIGTYSVAVLAKAHGIPFYVAAPSSTFDLSIATGNDIPIEERSADEITNGFGRQTAPNGVEVYNPAFDVTPADLIAAIITEKGLIEPVTANRVSQVLNQAQQ
ncbi:MAG: S-methyl-5-thioribose-1-phosphate isomerase [Planctomycetales bacterium]|nr:S-methyl-5-thioribose-1-phosphate isomerase [Planctomycetales bacterium]